MLQFISIHHQFGANVLFDGFSWHIKQGQKVGLVGPNGAGKTTLFLFAEGRLKPDSGEIIRSRGTSISLFHQIPNFDLEKSVIDTTLESNKLYSEYIDRKHKLDKKFESTDHESQEFEKLLEEQSTLEDFANVHDLHTLENKSKKILSGLGFSSDAWEKPIKNYSPGYQHRISLAIALLNPHTLLLLDEPTNHLDDKSKEWLIDYLQSVKTSFVLVTHDPMFLNSTIDTIAEISPHGVMEFKGTLEDFLEEKNEIHEKLKVQFKKEEAYIQKRSEWIERFRAKATKARQVQSAIKRLDKRDKIENPEEIFWNKKPDYNFAFTSSGKLSFRLEEAGFKYNDNGKFIFRNAKMEVSAGEKVAIVGPNGAGKSTLLRCIVGQFKFTEGKLSYGPKTKMGYFSQSHHEELDSSLNLIETVLKSYPDMSEEAVRKILGHFSFSGDSVYKKTASLSGGEQSRLRLSLLVLEPTNVLLLDEPTNHLDMVIRDGLKRAIADFQGSAIIISHDPDFLSGLCSRTFEVSDGEVKDLNCEFSEYLKYFKESESKSSNGNKDVNASEVYTKKNQERNQNRKKQKEFEDTEKKIVKLEDDIKELEAKIADPDFYKITNYKLELERYELSKKEIISLTEKWEALAEELG